MGETNTKFSPWRWSKNIVWKSNRLSIHEWLNNTYYPLCSYTLETVFHLLAECMYTKRIWEMMLIWTSQEHIKPTRLRQSTDSGWVSKKRIALSHPPNGIGIFFKNGTREFLAQIILSNKHSIQDRGGGQDLGSGWSKQNDYTTCVRPDSIFCFHTDIGTCIVFF